jgi:hypothetical protein
LGGSAGHIAHITECFNFTFGEIKDIILRVSAGKMRGVSTKFDGQNLMFSVSQLGVRVARNKTEMLTGGLSCNELTNKFDGRGDVQDAFINVYKVLSSVFKKESDEVLRNIFANGSRFYSIEIIYGPTRNVIEYDGNHVIFHDAPVFEVIKGEIVNVKCNANFPVKIKVDGWTLHRPFNVCLKQLDCEVAQVSLSKMNDLIGEAELTNENTLLDYLKVQVLKDVRRDLLLAPVIAAHVANRIVKDDNALSLTEIKKTLPKSQQTQVSDYVKNVGPQLVQKYVEPFETIIKDFSHEVLKQVQPVLVNDPERETKRIKDTLQNVINEMRQSEDVKTKSFVEKETMNFNVNNTLPIEGIVFNCFGKMLKLTANFGRVNKILGYYRYAR